MIRKVWQYQNWFGVSAGLCILAGLYMGLVTSPPDYYQGEVVRIMYLHVPLAKVSLLAYTTLFSASLWYLWKRDPLVDNLAQASAGVAAFFTLGALVTGSIWAKPTWNTWWTWDARLTSFAVLFLLLIGYLMLRRFIEDPHQEARLSAILAIVGFVDLPIVYFSVEWWRTLHQPLSVSIRGISFSPEMLTPLLVMLVGFNLLFVYMLFIRTQLLYLQHLLEAKKGRLLTRVHE